MKILDKISNPIISPSIHKSIMLWLRQCRNNGSTYLFSLYYSTAATSHNNLLEEILVNSLGFSKEKVISASAKVQNFFTPAESKAFVKSAESLGFVHQGSLGPAYGEAYRDNDRVSMHDPDLADAIWRSGLNRLFSDIKIRGRVAIGLNPNIRFYRYKAGQRFGRHIDESVDIGEGKRTYYTLLIYLSGGSKSKTKDDKESQDSLSETLVGGETVFYGPRNALVAEVPPTEGMALFHIHGDKCMLHEARNVTKGIKYILRSDVLFA